MILAFVDDLLFGSKIRTTGRQLGIDVTFVRSMPEAGTDAAAASPTLVLVDLNGRAFDPLAVIQSVKQNPTTSRARTLAFVSHVRADLVSAARAAGADEVLARSAFAETLPEILAAGHRGV